MTTKLYHHKTDGGAEYLCTSPVDGTDEGDLHTAIVRLDGEPELLNPSTSAASELLEALIQAEKLIADLNYAYYVKGTRKALDAVMGETKPALKPIRAAIAKAKGE